MASAHRRIAIVAGIAAIGLVAMGSASSQDVMLYNGTPSMPVGFYLRTSGEVERGAIVTVHAVDVAPGYAAERNVTDPGDRFLKRAGHHALMAQLGPIFEAGFIAHSFANRMGKGTHRAIEAYERYRDRHAFVLRCDVFRFFPAIDHAILKRDFRRRIACAPTLALMDKIVDGSNPQEPVNLHFPGDDLFIPFERRRGLPIGNLTSQWFANIFLDPLDHFCAEKLGAPYLRYVDDFALFADSVEHLEEWRNGIEAFLVRRRLKLHPRKTVILSTAEPATFLGYELHPGGGRRLPAEGVERARNRLRGIKDQLKADTIERAEARAKVQAWRAHADFAHAEHLQRAMLRGLPEDMRQRPRGQRRRRRKKSGGD